MSIPRCLTARYLACVLCLLAMVPPVLAQEPDVEPDEKLRAAAVIERTLGATVELNNQGRILVTKVLRGSPAFDAGVVPDDVIASIDDRTVVTLEELGKHLATKLPGDSAALGVSRRGELAVTQVHLTRPLVALPGRTSPAGQESGMLGMFVIENEKGLPVVSRVARETPAANAGVQKGDMILSVEEHVPVSLNDLSGHVQKIVQTAQPGQELSLRVRRGDAKKELRHTLVLPAEYTRPGVVKPELNTALAAVRVWPVDPNMPPAARMFVTLKDEGDSTRARIEAAGWPPGTYRLAIHEFGDVGDLANGSAGDVFLGQLASRAESDRAPGNLGLVEAGPDGTILNQMTATGLRLGGPTSAVGRALVVHGGTSVTDPPIAAGVVGIGNPRRAQSSGAPSRQAPTTAGPAPTQPVAPGPADVRSGAPVPAPPIPVGP